MRPSSERSVFTLLDNVPEEGILITKRGKPIARLMPVRPKRRKGKMITTAMIRRGGAPGPALGDGLTTPYDLIFD